MVCQKQDIVQAEFAVTTIKKIFERWTKSTEDQCVVVAFSSKPVDGGDADASQALLKLVLKSRLHCTGRFKLDSNFLLGKNVDPEVDNSEMKFSKSIIRMRGKYKQKDPEPICSFSLNLPPTQTMFTLSKCGWHAT